MPLIRSYPQAFSLQPDDAFVIDRIGVGTMYIEASALNTEGFSLIYATLPPGPTDNWDPTGWVPAVDAIVITSDVSGSTLQGLVGGTSDRRVVLANTSAGLLTIAQDSSGTLGNGFYCPQNEDIIVEPNGAVAFVYDAAANHWRMVLPEPAGGASAPVAFRMEASD